MGMTIASTTAGNTMTDAQRLSQGISSTGMASTAEEYQRLASISILPVYTNITITVPQGLLYNNRSRSQREPASNRSKLRNSPFTLYFSYGKLIFRCYHICATGALADSGALLIRTTLNFGSDASASALLPLPFFDLRIRGLSC